MSNLRPCYAKWHIVFRRDNLLIWAPGDCRCPKNAPPIPDGWEGRLLGGAYPYFLAWRAPIEPIFLAAKEAAEYGHDFFILPNLVYIPDSSHGCWKIHKWQGVLIWL